MLGEVVTSFILTAFYLQALASSEGGLLVKSRRTVLSNTHTHPHRKSKKGLCFLLSDSGATSCCSWEQAALTHCHFVRQGCPGPGKSQIDPPTAIVLVPCRAPMLQVSDRRNLLVVLVWAIHGWMAGIIVVT